MGTNDMAARRSAVPMGGPADGVRVTVTGRPLMLRATYPCTVEGATTEIRVESLHVYRLDGSTAGGLLRYGYDPASP